MKKIVGALLTGVLSVGMGLMGSPAYADPGDNPDNPIVVDSLDDIPEGAALSSVLNDDCSTTTTGVLTVPATDETSHQEFRYKRDIPAIDEVSHLEWGTEERTRTYTPAQEEVSHQESKYQRSVTDYKTQYHFRKFTRTKEQGPDLWWNFSPNHQQGPFILTAPSFPNDSRGTWQGPHENGGPQQDRYGTFANGNPIVGGNWFHRDEGVWGEFGPWTPWVPETHTSWEDSDAPLGSPQFHGQGDGWYREWQAMFDGQTRQVENGSHLETTDWLTEPPEGEGWELIDTRTVIDTVAVPASYGPWSDWTTRTSGETSEPTLPANTDTHEYRITGPVKVVDVEYEPGYTEYYVLGGEPSLNEEDASWILAEQALEGWTQFDERTVVDKEGTPEVVTYYEYNDGKECPPEEPPVTPEPPKEHNPPKTPNTPDVPTAVDAGLTGAESDSSEGLLYPFAALAMLTLVAGGTLALKRRGQ